MKTRYPTTNSGTIGKGFTLVELLTVIAIIGILAAITLGAIGQVRNKAKAVKCLSNLRQIGIAASLYSSENRGKLVPVAAGTASWNMVTWRIHLNPWLYQKNNANSVLQCPSLEPPVQDDTTLRQGTRPASYGLNFSNGLHEYKDGGTNIEGARETDVVNPSGTILACDIAKITAVSNTPSDWVVSNSITNFGYARFPSNWSNDPWVIFPRHSGRANVLFYDGHTKSVDVLADIINAPRDNAACIYDNQ